MTLAALDPGSFQSALTVFNPDKQRIESHGIHANSDILNMIRFLPKRITVFACEIIASYGFSVGKEVFDTCHFTGRCVEAASRHEHATLFPVYRKQVLSYFKAKNDSTLRAAMIARFGDQTGCRYDLWSSLAVAAFAGDRLAVGAAPPAFPPAL